MSDIRKFMNLVELGEPGQQTNRDEHGRVLDPNVSYEVSDTKVVATLKSYKSQSYTKLAQKIEEIQALEARVKDLETEIKQEGRDAIADLFSASDAARTRVIDTVSFIMKLTKDPEPATTVKYAKVIEELANHLTPELKTVMQALVAKHTTVQKAKPASLSYEMKPKESVELSEGVWDKLKGVLSKFKSAIMNWANKYDSKLDALKAEAGLTEAAVVEAPMAFSAGQTVYSGSKQGTVVGSVPNKPESTIIELPNGERQVVATSSLSMEKPGLMKRASSWLVGEDEELNEYDKVGRDFQSPHQLPTQSEAEMISKWETPKGIAIYLWTDGKGGVKVVNGKGKTVNVYGDPKTEEEVVRTLKAVYGCKEVHDHKEMALEADLDAEVTPDVEPGQQGLTELSDQPEDTYPVAATLSDEELSYFMQIWSKMTSVTADPALAAFGEELKAECAARGLAC